MSTLQVGRPVPDGLLMGARKWLAAASAVATGVAVHLVEPHTLAGDIAWRGHEASLVTLGVQLTTLALVRIVQRVKVKGSFTVEWGSKRDDSSDS
ncbi:hypothetical protein GCM10010302_09870 [Streptomyces polychromogenes]|uniref:Uncharacterized protein n=1 Tax=Streptomyces polychromogenes TaxID=67342 RepID=A0ABN0V4B0_9ACTN